MPNTIPFPSGAPRPAGQANVLQSPRPKPFQLCLGIPYYGMAHADFIRAIMRIVIQRPCELSITDNVGDSLIPRSRNTIASQFLATDRDALLFLDSDIILTPEQIQLLLSHDLERTPVVCGMYPKKRLDLQWVLNTFDDNPHPQPGPDGLIPVKYAGTGVMLISRAILDAIRKRFPLRTYHPDSDEGTGDRYDFFPAGVAKLILPELLDQIHDPDRYLSEDWAFCELVRAVGGSVHVDTRVQTRHIGTQTYPIDLAQAIPAELKQSLRSVDKLRTHLSNVTVYQTDTTNTRLIALDPILAAFSPDTSNAA